MGGRSKEKSKAAASNGEGRARTKAARRARAAPRTGTKQARQASGFWRRGTVRGETSEEHRRAGGDGQIGGGTDRQRKFRSSSEGEMRGVGRTRPGKAKERVTEERVNMKAKEEELEGKEHSRPRTW